MLSICQTIHSDASQYRVNNLYMFTILTSSFPPHLTSSIRPANRPAFGGTVPLFYQMSRVPLNQEISRFLYEVGFFVCARANHANHPIERIYGNSVRFLAKIPKGTAAESPCPANRPAFCRQVPLFYAKCPSKNIIQVGRSALLCFLHCPSLGTVHHCWSYNCLVYFSLDSQTYSSVAQNHRYPHPVFPS